MSESFERLRGVRELPLFPLPLVLFPGVPLPLHIFEERYRQMLRDVRARNNIFGVSYFDPEKMMRTRPPITHVGCAAEIIEVQPLPDGRSNILTLGLARYRVESYLDDTEPYLVGEVTFFEDEKEASEELERNARVVANLFTRIARSVRTINEERASIPELPNSDPERLSFLVASAMEMDLEAKQELLELQSTNERLKRIRELLAQVVDNYEERARVHGVAKGNGHAGKKFDV